MNSLSDLAEAIRKSGAVAVNIHASPGGFRAHVRMSQAVGFSCAQKEHATLAAALNEHFGAEEDDGLLV